MEELMNDQKKKAKMKKSLAKDAWIDDDDDE